jgi:DNA-binding transcriptional LysR family regulator
MAQPSLDLYVIFSRVAETGGFSQAARALGLSKATVSKAIAELERSLGVQLIARTTRRLALTEPGERILRRALRIVEEAEAALEDAGEARAAPRGRLKIAAPLTFSEIYLAPLLADFLQTYPDIELELSLDDRVVDLIGGGFDAALRIGDMPDSSFAARVLAPVRVHVIASPRYWAARGTPQRPEDLALHACLRYANLPTAGVWRFQGPDGAPILAPVSGPLCVNNGRVELTALCAGLGVARLPDFMIWPDVVEGRLVPALEAFRPPDLSLHLLTPYGRNAPRKLKVFSDLLADHFSAGRAPWLGKIGG